jgi:Peptidase family M23
MVVYWGGRTERQNNHTVTPDPRHAYDLVKWRRGGTFVGRGTRNRDYFAFDRRVVAPAGGVVVEAHDGLRDNRPFLEGASRPAPTGNHVLLALGADRYVLLAHLKRGSVPVHSGQRVRTGQALGRVGTRATRPSHIFTTTWGTIPPCTQAAGFRPLPPAGHRRPVRRADRARTAGSSRPARALAMDRAPGPRLSQDTQRDGAVELLRDAAAKGGREGPERSPSP